MSSNQDTSLSVAELRSDEFAELQANAYRNDLARLHKRLDEFVVVACPACGGESHTYRFEKYRCRFVECAECATLYMSPRPTPSVMDDYYNNSENYAIWNQYIFPKSETSRREKLCRPNLERIIKECTHRGMVKPSIIEIGPGFGTFSALTRDSGFFGSVAVIERTPSMAQACRDRGLKVIESALEEISQDLVGSADVVVCFEVIEHIFEPSTFLSGINRMLKPGGVLMFTCPNGAGFDTEMLQAASPAVDTEHVNLFNPQSVGVFLQRGGFVVEQVETPGRLDVELVRRAVMAKQLDLSAAPFWRRVLLDEFATLGAEFQRFLVEHKLSGNMRVIAIKSVGLC